MHFRKRIERLSPSSRPAPAQPLSQHVDPEMLERLTEALIGDGPALDVREILRGKDWKDDG